MQCKIRLCMAEEIEGWCEECNKTFTNSQLRVCEECELNYCPDCVFRYTDYEDPPNSLCICSICLEEERWYMGWDFDQSSDCEEMCTNCDEHIVEHFCGCFSKCDMCKRYSDETHVCWCGHTVCETCGFFSFSRTFCSEELRRAEIGCNLNFSYHQRDYRYEFYFKQR